MKTDAVVATCLLFGLVAVLLAGHTPNSLFVLNEWVSYRLDANDALARTLIDANVHGLQARKAVVSEMEGQEWFVYRDSVRAKLRPMFESFFPTEKTPLNAKVTGTVKGPKGITVEKIYFESRPGFYVTGAVFLPANATGRHPAILHASGHTPYAFRYRSSGSYQLACLSLAAKGFVVLAFDPIGQGERIMYWDRDRNQSKLPGACSFNPVTFARQGMGCTQEHSYYGRQLHLNGAATASLFLWDAVRALDYLEQRNDVDPTRLGMFGCSGGGTQTAYMGAYDERLKAVSIGCYMGSLAYDMPYQGTADAEQVWLGGTVDWLDKADLLHARLPKATHVQMTTNDDCFPVQGGREAVAEAQKSFKAVGAAESFGYKEDIGGHGTTQPTRESMYGFFLEHLNVSGKSDEPSLPLLNYSELLVVPDGQVAVSLASKTVPVLVNDLTTSNQRAVEKLRRAGYVDKFLQNLPHVAASMIAGHLPNMELSLPYQAISMGRLIDNGVDTEKWLVETIGHCKTMVEIYTKPEWKMPVPPPEIWISSPASGRLNGVTGSVVIVNGQQTNDTETGQIVEELLANELAAVKITPCGFGESGSAFPKAPHSEHDYRAGHVAFLAQFVNSSVVGVHAAELAQTLSFVHRRLSLTGVGVNAVVSQTFLGSAVAHLAVIERGGLLGAMQSRLPTSDWLVPALVAVEDVLSYGDIAKTTFYHTPSWMDIKGVLREYDLCDIYAAMAPTPLLLVGPTDARLVPLSDSAIAQELSWTKVAYSSSELQWQAGWAPKGSDLARKVIEWIGSLDTIPRKNSTMLLRPSALLSSTSSWQVNVDQSLHETDWPIPLDESRTNDDDIVPAKATLPRRPNGDAHGALMVVGIVSVCFVPLLVLYGTVVVVRRFLQKRTAADRVPLRRVTPSASSLSSDDESAS